MFFGVGCVAATRAKEARRGSVAIAVEKPNFLFLFINFYNCFRIFLFVRRKPPPLPVAPQRLLLRSRSLFESISSLFFLLKVVNFFFFFFFAHAHVRLSPGVSASGYAEKGFLTKQI